MNEFLYELMKKNGIAARMDENIGFEFINFSSELLKETVYQTQQTTEGSDDSMDFKANAYRTSDDIVEYSLNTEEAMSLQMKSEIEKYK